MSPSAVNRRLSVLSFSVAALAAAPLFAQQTPSVAPPVVVSADRMPVPAAEVTATVTVIDSEEIERRQLRTINDILRAVPGVSTVQSGGAGKLTSVFVRGANSNHTTVLVDGMRVSDPSTAGGTFNFAHLMAENVDRVEIVRGPMSALYGSDAIGGVINIVTRKGKGPAHGSVMGEAGSHGTASGGAGVRGSQGKFNYNVALAATHVAGQTVAPQRFRLPGQEKENDSYDNMTFSSRLGVDPTENVQLSLFSRFITSRNEYDAFTSEDPNAREKSRQIFNRVQAEIDAYGGFWKPTVGLSMIDTKRNDRDPPDAFNPFPFPAAADNHGQRWQAEWSNIFTFSKTFSMVAGVDAEHSRFNAKADGVKSKGDADIAAAYVNGRAAFFDRVFFNLGGRIEEHSDFGTHFTWRAGGAYLHRETDTRLHASYGTSFKAPGLFELYGAAAFCAGNRSLQPEKSKGFEVGVDQALFGDMVKGGATLFRNDIRDLIQCPAPFVALQNVAKARTQGVETYFEIKPHETVSLRFEYTYTDSENRTTGAPLLRRPRHKTGVTAEWRPLEDWTFGFEAIRNAGRRDADAALFTTTNPESYTLVRILAAYDVIPAVQVFGRVENALDKRYDEPDGFKAPSFGAYGGVRVKF